MQANVDKLKTDIGTYTDVWKQADEHDTNSPHVDGVLMDTDLNRVSQNYKNILWTILAILIIIGGIRLTRNNSS